MRKLFCLILVSLFFASCSDKRPRAELNAFVMLGEEIEESNDLIRELTSRKISSVYMALTELRSIESTSELEIENQQALADKLTRIAEKGKEVANYFVGKSSFMITTSDRNAPLSAQSIGNYDNLIDGEYYYEDEDCVIS